MMPSTTSLLGLMAMAACLASAVDDLRTVLDEHRNLTTFNDIIRRHPEFLLELPSVNGITIIAPSDAAFENIPYTSLNGVWDTDNQASTLALLQYHVLRSSILASNLVPGPTYLAPSLLTSPAYTNVTTGQNVLINVQPGEVVILTSGLGTRCTVVQPDLEFQGGVIHVVDNLLVPPSLLNRTAEAFSLMHFLGGLYAGDVMPALATRQNVTVFAPQDAALDAVAGTLADMDGEQLARVMGYHVVPGQVLSSDALANGTVLQTLARGADDSALSLVVRQAGNNKYINSAQIVQPDILIANGILHVVSNVLNPDAAAAAPDPVVGTQPPVFPVSLVPDAFSTALPCTTDCPVPTTSVSRTAGANGAASTSTTVATTTADGAGSARCTAHVAAAAVGALGLGAGMVWL